MKKNINLNKINNLYELRLHNIKLCIRMIKKAINAYQKNKKFNKIKQKKIGRYYSSMPKELILITIQKFKKFVNNNGN